MHPSIPDVTVNMDGFFASIQKELEKNYDVLLSIRDHAEDVLEKVCFV